MSARRALLAAALVCATVAHAANPPNDFDLPSANIVPAPIDMTPQRPAESAPEAAPLPPPRAPAAKASAPSANPLWSVPLSMLTATRERPLFSPSRRPMATPTPAPAALYMPPTMSPPEPERLSLVLIGAIAGDTESFAVFLDQATNAVIRLRTGQEHRGWILRAVKGREATLEKASASTTLMLPEPGMASALTPGIRRQPNGEPQL